jgi:hypothetical protein
MFFLYAVPACVAWAPFYLLPGAAFGASLELAAQFAGRLATLLAILVLGGWFLLWMTRQVYEFTARRSSWWLRSLIRWVRNHPRVGRLFGPLLEPGGREILSVTWLGLVLLASFALLLGVLLAAPWTDLTWDAQRQLAGWAGSLRSHFADPVFAAISLATGSRVLLLLAGLMLLMLLSLGRPNAAWHWSAAILGGWFIGELLIAFTHGLAEPPAQAPSLGEVPHRPFLLACLVLTFFAVMLAKDLSARHRKWPYLFTALLLGLSGFAHFYLGQASLLGLLAALALGTGWVALIGMAYRLRATRRPHGTVLALVFYGFGAGAALVNIDTGLDEMLARSAVPLPELQLQDARWRESEWRQLPERISSFGSTQRSRFDIQVAADLGAIESALLAEGWEQVAKVRLADLGSLLIGQPDIEGLPHLNRDFAGRPDALMLRRRLDGERVVLLRLWASGARLLPGEVPVWLGQVRVVEPRWVLGSLTRWFEVENADEQARAALDEGLAGAWRRSTPEGPVRYAVPD